MDSKQRDDLVVAFKAKHGGDRTDPMLTLLENLSLETLAALVACCDRYMNFELRLKARQMTSKGPTFIVKTLGEIDRALQGCDSEACPGEPSRKAAAVPLMIAIDEDQGEPQVERAAFDYLVALDYSRHTAAKNVWPNKLIKQIEQSFGAAARHERQRAMLDDAAGREELLQFLVGCAKMAVEIHQNLMTNFDLSETVAAFLRLHVDDSDKLESAGLEAALLEVLEPKVELAADQALNLEREWIESGKLTVPRTYIEPFGSVRGLNAQLPMECHSYFACRVALAAVACLGELHRNGDLEFMESLLHELWSYSKARYLTPDDPKKTRFLKGLSEEFCDSYGVGSIEYRAWRTFEALSLTREYVVADEWQDSLGYHGLFVNAAHALLSVTTEDHMRLRQVFERLVCTGFRESALIALAAKLGCFYHGLFEPTCARPRPAKERLSKGSYQKDQGTLNAASNQIDVIQQLVSKIEQHVNPGSVPLLRMTERIYFKDAPRRHLPQDGFDWNFHEIQWNLLRSDSHITGGVPGAHLWLYGKCFQKVVDEAIRETEDEFKIENESIESTSHPDWPRLARFIFLVPYVKNTRKRLADWSQERNRHVRSKHQMKAVLKRLCGLGAYADVNVYRHLALPILRPDHKVSHDNVLFAPQA